MKLTFSSLLFIFLWLHLYAFLPLMGRLLRRNHPAKPPAPRRTTIAFIVAHETCFAGFALLVAYWNEIPIFGSIHFDLRIIMLASAFLVLALCLDALHWKYMSAPQRDRLNRLLPYAPGERMAWVPVSAITSVAEEIVYRAVLPGIFLQITGDYWIAAAISAVLFAISHLSHGTLSVVALFFVALGLQWLVKTSGGLYVAIAIHFMHNLVNGYIYQALGRIELEGSSGVNAEGNR